MVKRRVKAILLRVLKLLPNKIGKRILRIIRRIGNYIYRYLPKNARYVGRVTKLNAEIKFPPMSKANKRIRFGPIAYLLAYGGDLSVERMVEAMKQGVGPFFIESEPYLWWVADERCVIFLDSIHIERTIKKLLKKELFTLTSDRAFVDVLHGCRDEHCDYIWLTDERISSLEKLHEAGYTHSIELWQDGTLVGGLFGFHMGEYFHIESNFYRITNASKITFIALCLRLRELGFKFFDLGTWPTEHSRRLGGTIIPKDEFTELLSEALSKDSPIDDWDTIFDGWDVKKNAENYLKNKSCL